MKIFVGSNFWIIGKMLFFVFKILGCYINAASRCRIWGTHVPTSIPKQKITKINITQKDRHVPKSSSKFAPKSSRSIIQTGAQMKPIRTGCLQPSLLAVLDRPAR